MDALWPNSDTGIDTAATIAAESRTHSDGSPWLVMVMITSLDGVLEVDGRSQPLGGAADLEAFRAMRACADAIVVAGGTARTENYGAPRVAEPLRSARIARGQTAAPRLVVVSGSLDFDPAMRLFEDPEAPPLLLTTTASPAAKRAELDACAEIVTVAEAAGGGVAAAAVVAELGRRGFQTVIVEGGPVLNATLITADVIDELHLSLSPVLVGGTSRRITWGAAPATPAGFELNRIFGADGLLFLRYLRSRGRRSE